MRTYPVGGKSNAVGNTELSRVSITSDGQGGLRYLTRRCLAEEQVESWSDYVLAAAEDLGYYELEVLGDIPTPPPNGSAETFCVTVGP